MFRQITNRMLAVLIAGGFLGTAASATITASHELWRSGVLRDGTPFESYRIFVNVTDTTGLGPDDWTAAGLEMALLGGTFYQNWLGGDPPNPALFPFDPDLEFDSYYTYPGNYPNTSYSTPPVYECVQAPSWLDCDWFDTENTGNGYFVIAQITVLPHDPDWTATGHLQYTSLHAGGDLFDYYFVIPQTRPGDVDHDGDVDLSDLAALLAAYGTCVGDAEYNPDADFDDSGCVDLSDLAELLSHYGEGT